MHFKTFLKVKVQNWGYFLGLLKFQIFFGVLEIPDFFFWVKGRWWVRAYVCRKNESTSPGALPGLPADACDFGLLSPRWRIVAVRKQVWYL